MTERKRKTHLDVAKLKGQVEDLDEGERHGDDAEH